MMLNMFVVILHYIADIETIDKYRPDHLKFLDIYYSNGTFIVFGRQVPITGGVIIAKNVDRSSLEQILSEDPFAVHNLAEYQIYEFTPTKYIPEFKTII